MSPLPFLDDDAFLSDDEETTSEKAIQNTAERDKYFEPHISDSPVASSSSFEHISHKNYLCVRSLLDAPSTVNVMTPARPPPVATSTPTATATPRSHPGHDTPCSSVAHDLSLSVLDNSNFEVNSHTTKAVLESILATPTSQPLTPLLEKVATHLVRVKLAQSKEKNVVRFKTGGNPLVFQKRTVFRKSSLLAGSLIGLPGSTHA